MMTIYEEEQQLRSDVCAALQKIREERPNVTGQTLAQYSYALHQLHAVQDLITSLEESDDLHHELLTDLEAPVATVGPNVPEGR